MGSKGLGRFTVRLVRPTTELVLSFVSRIRGVYPLLHKFINFQPEFQRASKSGSYLGLPHLYPGSSSRLTSDLYIAVSLLAVGTVAFDSIETPFGSADRILGGSATYITLAARYFVDAPRLVAVVGRDFPDAHIDLLTERGINTEGLEKNAEDLTFFWAGRYHFDMNNRDTLTTDLNVLARFNPSLPASYLDTDIVCLGNLQPDVQAHVMDQVENPRLVICDTMNFWIEHTPDSLRETLRRIDILIINDEETRQLADEPNLVRAARKVRAMGPQILIVKKGEHGAMLFAEDTIFWAPALPLEDIIDPTGAGDTFMGGFAGYLAGQETLDMDAFKSAIIYGSAMASFVVEKFGPERLYDLTPYLIEKRVEAFRTLSHFPAVRTLVP